MFPTAFRIPFIERDIPGYGLMLMIGFLLAVGWAARRARKSHGNPEVVLNCGFVALIAGVVGCRGMYVVHYWDQFANRGSLGGIIWAIVDVSKGGLEFYGGFILSVILVPLWLRVFEKVSLRWYMDILAPSAALGLAIGRIGCLANGCCYGSTCEQPWAISFPFGSSASVEQWKHRIPGSSLPKELLVTLPPGVTTPITRESIAAGDAEIAAAEANEKAARETYSKAREELTKADAAAKKPLEQKVNDARNKLERAVGQFRDIRINMAKYGLSAAQIRTLAAQYRSLSVHPAQIYSTITAGLLAWLLHLMYWRRTRDGQIILLLLLVEPVSRYVLEIVRADNPVDALGVFTISQALGIAMSGLAALGLVALQFSAPRSRLAVEWTPEPEAAPAK
ncbi:MAG: prolipoprotein diacylglyceryl transferase [Planctomycetes bacterium]|nr:prolipoprotein diacylglyceryl transferase [Planctomycetota bacterium]